MCDERVELHYRAGGAFGDGYRDRIHWLISLYVEDFQEQDFRPRLFLF